MNNASHNAVDIARSVRSGQTSAADVVRAAITQIETGNDKINCFTQITRDRALAEAATVDQLIAAGQDPGPLAGVPYAVKNLFDVQGLPTLAGSKINAAAPPAATDATLVRKLGAAGAVLVGTLNMDEYAYGFTTENSHYGATANPHDTRLIAGGSSGGSAAAVAAGMVPITLGSDTNGSIRVPSSLSGIFGLKPTYGRLSRAGAFPFVGSLDHVGPFARTVEDLALVYDLLQGPDPEDSACRQRQPEPSIPNLNVGIDGLRVAVAGDYFENGAEPEALEAVSAIARTLGTTCRVTLPEAARARAAAFIITASEGGNLHLGRLKHQGADFDPKTRDRLLAGALLPAAWYIQAQRFRRWYYIQVMALFQEVDVILLPATPRSATPIGQETMVVGGKEMLIRPNMGMYTQPISFIGLPVVVVPVHRTGRMPIGVQIVAAPWREEICLQVARVLETVGVVSAPIAH